MSDLRPSFLARIDVCVTEMSMLSHWVLAVALTRMHRSVPRCRSVRQAAVRERSKAEGDAYEARCIFLSCGDRSGICSSLLSDRSKLIASTCLQTAHLTLPTSQLPACDTPRPQCTNVGVSWPE